MVLAGAVRQRAGQAAAAAAAAAQVTAALAHGPARPGGEGSFIKDIERSLLEDGSMELQASESVSIESGTGGSTRAEQFHEPRVGRLREVGMAL